MVYAICNMYGKYILQSLVVMPGCTLEVWDKGSGLADAKKEEAKSYNKGNYKDNEDRYDRNKLVFSAFKDIQIVEEINDDFDDMDEDIESYRWGRSDYQLNHSHVYVSVVVATKAWDQLENEKSRYKKNDDLIYLPFKNKSTTKFISQAQFFIVFDFRVTVSL